MKQKDSKRVFNGFINVDELELETKSGKTIKRLVTHRGSAVCGILFDPKTNNVILTSQYRPGSSKQMLEVIAGCLEIGENPDDCIVREALEETGYEVKSSTKITECYLSPGGSTEKMIIYYLIAGDKVANGGGLEEENEEIDVVEMPLNKFLNFKFDDAKTIICQYWLINNK